MSKASGSRSMASGKPSARAGSSAAGHLAVPGARISAFAAAMAAARVWEGSVKGTEADLRGKVARSMLMTASGEEKAVDMRRLRGDEKLGRSRRCLPGLMRAPAGSHTAWSQSACSSTA